MRLKPSFTSVESPNGQTLVSKDNEEFAGLVHLNESATFLIEELKHERSYDKLVDALSERYNITRAQASEDVRTLIETLSKIGALENTQDERQANKENSSSFEEELKERGSFVYRNVGISMLPLIRSGRDLIVIEPKTKGRLKKLDVVLYKRGESYILHRIVEVRENDYVILGDNCLKKEYGIHDNDIVGVMSTLIRDNKTIKVNDASYLRFSRAWVASYPLRKPFMHVAFFAARCVKALIKKFDGLSSRG